MNKFIAVCIIIAITVGVGSTFNKDGNGSVKGTISTLQTTSANGIKELTDDL